MNRTSRLAATIVFIISATATFGQLSASSEIPKQDADNWLTYFPPIDRCEGKTFPILIEKSGVIAQLTRYEPVFKWPVGTPEAPVVISESEAAWQELLECGRIVFSFDLYRTSPELLSKQELKEAKQYEKENRRNARKSAKMYEGFVFGAPARPPRALKINGFDAYQIFSPPSDTLPDLFDLPYTTIRMKFAEGKELVIYDARVNYDEAIKVLESVNYHGLSKAMDRFVAKRKRN